ncbi:MAG: NAD(+)/NADH kinase [Chlamydiia bacterium]|nr:NAD(+)/NADH kinase [Chlamydiia bacterium]
MIIALYFNETKPKARNIAISVREFLVSHGVTVVVADEQAGIIDAQPLSSIDPKSVDFIISMGGDGTILKTVHRFPDLQAPVLGINLGSLGFMADIPTSDIYPSLQDLLDGAYRVQERIMMKGRTVSGEECFAVNDIVIHRSHNPTLIDLAIHVDGIYLNTFSADGMIAATPTGSTAYSLAAGGPIITPEIEAFALTPISPHTVSNRPLILMPNNEIQIQLLSECQPIEISVDGQAEFSMHSGDVFHIQRSDRRFRLISLLRHDYFSTLRSKLGWSGKLRH